MKFGTLVIGGAVGFGLWKLWPLLQQGKTSQTLMYDVSGFSLSKGKKLTELIANVRMRFRNPSNTSIKIQYIYLDVLVNGRKIAETREGNPSGNPVLTVAPGVGQRTLTGYVNLLNAGLVLKDSFSSNPPKSIKITGYVGIEGARLPVDYDYPYDFSQVKTMLSQAKDTVKTTVDTVKNTVDALKKWNDERKAKKELNTATDANTNTDSDNLVAGIGAPEVLAQGKKLDFKGYKPSYEILENYDHLIDDAENSDQLKGHGLDATIELMIKTIQNSRKQVEKLSKHLFDSDYKQACFNVWHWLITNIPFQNDTPGREEIRTPARSWSDKKNGTGIDCDDFTTFGACLLINMDYIPNIRVVAFLGRLNYSHVYLTYKDVIIDAVMKAFNEHPAHITKFKEMPIPVYGLSGLDEIGKIKIGKKLKKAAQKVTKFVKKTNPVLATGRGALRLLLSVNFRGMATKLASNKDGMQKAISVFEKFGGKGSNLEKSIEKGKFKKPIFDKSAKELQQKLKETEVEGLGDPTIAALIASATPLLVALKPILDKIKEAKDKEEASTTPDQNTANESDVSPNSDENIIPGSDPNTRSGNFNENPGSNTQPSDNKNKWLLPVLGIAVISGAAMFMSSKKSNKRKK